MFIDISTYVGHWPFRELPNNTLEGLDQLAQNNEITHMVVSNIEGFFYKDVYQANLSLLKQWKAYSGKTEFLPLAIINPTYPEWERDAREMISLGFMGFEIAPFYHFYSFKAVLPYDDYVTVHYAKQVLDLAEELDVPVRVCTSVENFRARSNYERYDNPTGEDINALLRANPNTHLMITSFNPSAADAELIRKRPNTYFDLTAISAGALCSDVAKNAANLVAPNQLCYGSLAPFQYMEPTLIALEYEDAIHTESAKNAPARAFQALR